MSFILEALKKSENKHRNKNGGEPRTIHEPVPRNSSKFRPGLVLMLILLMMGTALLFWFLGSWQKTPSVATKDVSSEHVAMKKTAEIVTDSAPAIAPTSRKTQTSPVEVKRQPDATDPLPVPRNEKKVYRFGELPMSVQKRIPTLNMSLHAYNRADASSSMVQLNDKIMHEGDAVTDRIRLESISADGAILSYDGYRFLLPRQGS